jgi:hypothetical protein
MTIEVLDIGRGFAGILAIGRESVPADEPGYQRTERGSKELNISIKP